MDKNTTLGLAAILFILFLVAAAVTGNPRLAAGYAIIFLGCLTMMTAVLDFFTFMAIVGIIIAIAGGIFIGSIGLAFQALLAALLLILMHRVALIVFGL